jgi:hypothetical protein
LRLGQSRLGPLGRFARPIDDVRNPSEGGKVSVSVLRRLQVPLLAAIVTAVVCLFVGVPSAGAVGPNAIVFAPGCLDNTLAANDDSSTGVVDLPFGINFFGTTYSSGFVNNNGNVTFAEPLSTFTPFDLTTAGTPIIAPFFADVDTRGAGSGLVHWGDTTFGGRPAWCVLWTDVAAGVGYFGSHTDKLNSFQLLLVDRSDEGPGDFDIVFNYDQIQWETGDASGGAGGLGGFSARAGFSNGSSAAPVFLELPGSAVNGAFLDSNVATGLIHSSRNTLQIGRYVFAVRNGAPPTGGTISGTVTGPGGAGIASALVQVCLKTTGICVWQGTTNSSGDYTATGIADGAYDVRAYPPSGSNLIPGQIDPEIIGGNTVPDQDVALQGPSGPPLGTTVVGAGTNSDGLPVLVIGRPVRIETTGCDGGLGTYMIQGSYGATQTGSMLESPPGTYFADVTPNFVGPALVTIAIDGCPTIVFNVYIDPSGFVKTVGGTPVEGATVTLFRSDSGGDGTFVQVPDQDGIMSPGNRDNPDLTDATGHFGWDVVAGFYKVRAAKAGCHKPGDATTPFVETIVYEIPPPVLDIDLRLDCGAEANVPPEAVDDDASGVEDTELTIAKATLLANDSDGGDGGALELTAVSDASGGTVEISEANVVFHPAANLCGDNAASFRYTVSDGTDTATGTVTIDLACVADLHDVIAALVVIIAASDSSLADKLEDVLAKLEAASGKLDADDRQGGLGELEGAVGDLEAAVKAFRSFSVVGTGLMNDLAAISRSHAEDAIDEAVARDGDTGKIDAAEIALAGGDARRNAGRFKSAVAKYKDAAAMAEGA